MIAEYIYMIICKSSYCTNVSFLWSYDLDDGEASTGLSQGCFSR